MSPFHTFQPACNTIETGSEYPQVQKMAPGYDYRAANSVYALSKAVEKFPDFTPNFDYFVAQGKAKLTDLLSVATVNGGFLISNRFKFLLEKFNIAQHRFYPAKVSYKKQLYDYYWMHIISDLTNFVDTLIQHFLSTTTIATIWAMYGSTPRKILSYLNH